MGFRPAPSGGAGRRRRPRPRRCSSKKERPSDRLSDLARHLSSSAPARWVPGTPGYYNNEGKPGERSGQNGFYGGGPVEFFKILEDWRAKGGLKGLELS